MLDFCFNNNELIVNNKKISFDYHVKDVIEYNDLLIVTLDNIVSRRAEDQPLNNIYAYNQDGIILWSIIDIIKHDNRYGGASVEDGCLLVHDFIGINYYIDVIEKTIIKKRGVR